MDRVSPAATKEREAELKCSNCHYYEPLRRPKIVESHDFGKITVHGECRRLPPTLVRTKNCEGFTFFPVFPFVSKSHWCGSGKWDDVNKERSFERWDRLDQTVLEGIALRHDDW